MWPDDNGDWGNGWDNGGFTEPTNAAATSLDNSPVSAAGGSSKGSNDQWGNVFSSLLGTVTNYAIAKDAKQSGMTYTTSASGQPVYRPGAPALSGGALLVLAGLAFFALKH